MNIREKLQKIQVELKAPKNHYSDFGGYKYRSAEDILEGVKKLLDQYGVIITIHEDIKEVSGRLFIHSIARVTDTEQQANEMNGNNYIEASGYAEFILHKKMSEAQITGATSSFAKKYALQNLLAIDDQKDIDGLPPDKPRSTNPQPKSKPKPQPKSIENTDTYKDFLDIVAPMDAEDKREIYQKYLKGKNPKYLKEAELRLVINDINKGV